VTELLLRQSFDKIMTQTSKLLGLDYATVNDLMLRDSLMTITGLQVKYAGARASRDLLTASDSFNTALVKDGVELLATNNVPKINGDFYVVFVHPHQARKMRDDAAWINASQYGAPDQIFKGEIGRYEDAVFIETTQIKSIAAGVAFNGVTNATVPTYQAVMFGADAFAKAIALPVEMRDNGIEDFSRKHSLACSNPPKPRRSNVDGNEEEAPHGDDDGQLHRGRGGGTNRSLYSCRRPRYHSYRGRTEIGRRTRTNMGRDDGDKRVPSNDCPDEFSLLRRWKS
jgi:N4-gp56 family major capsid protein